MAFAVEHSRRGKDLGVCLGSALSLRDFACADGGGEIGAQRARVRNRLSIYCNGERIPSAK